jgi:hypothetical protein
MDSNKNENITRRKLIKGVAGAAACCACFSLDCSVDLKGNSEDKIKNSKGKVLLTSLNTAKMSR